MDEDVWSKRRREAIAVVTERLLDLRWTILAAVVAILVLHFWAGEAPRWINAVALVAVVAVAAFAPRGADGRRRAGDAPGITGDALDHLAAADLAAAVPDPLLVFDRQGIVVHANDAASASFGSVKQGIALRLKVRAPEMQ